MDQLVEYSLIRIFGLLKQILWSIDRLFQEKNSQKLKLSIKFKLKLSIKFQIKSEKNGKIINE